MKRFLSYISFTALLVTLTAVFSACSKDSVKTLYVYNWGEYISDGSEDCLDVNAAFEEYYLETYGERIEVNYSTYSSNEDMYAKIKSGAVNYDVIIPSDYMIERLISEKLLAPLDYDNIPNYQYITEDFKGENAYYDPENLYSVPYFYGMVGVIYNSALVDESNENIGSWELMWDEAYSGEILQFNNSRDAFGTALYYLGYDVNEATNEEWREALSLLKKQKSVVQGYVMDEIFNKMKGGSASVASYYAGDFISMYESNEDLSFYYPKEGTNIFVDAMCVPKASENKELAEIYINFMLSEDIAVANAEYTYYASPNSLVINSEEYIGCMEEIHPDAMSILYTGNEGVYKSFYKNLSSEKLTMINELWEELKIESSIGSGVFAVCAVIIIALLALTVYSLIKKYCRAKLCDKLFE